ncbi:MAG: hypothetical protein CMJ64_08040 [Planctomycetaceae bacterium]|nr:hypothetical protein [Planctomycetaceae bacterium]
MKAHRCVLILLGIFPLMTLPRAGISQTITVNTRDQIVKAVDNATPGATILIAPGTYQGGLNFNGLRGEQNKPIILAAADKESPPVFKGRNSCFHLTDPAFVELHSLVLTEASGNGLNIDDGGSYDTPAHHVVLRGLTIRDVGPGGNHDGIKLSGLDNFRVEDCTIERWGSSGSAIDMVGCHNGKVSGCTFRHRSDVAGSGIQTKGGSRDIAIQQCRFENAGARSVNIGGSTGLPYFRPKVDGYEAKDITVEDCTFIGPSAPICFVGVDGAIVRYNTIYQPGRYVVRILQESRGSQFVPCRNGVFTNNVIAFRSDETRRIANIGAGTAPKTFKFANNHWYCIDRPERSNRFALPVKETGGSHGTDPQFVNAAKGDLRLQDTSPVQDAGVRAR